MHPIGDLSRRPLVVADAIWTPKTVRTRGVSGPLHQEWRLLVRFECKVPSRALVYLDSEGVRRHSRRWARRASTLMDLEIVFMPWDWENSDVVTISAEETVQVESAELKEDPVAATVVEVAEGSAGSTAAPMTVLTIPSVGVELGILAVVSTNTRANRTSWRVREEYAEGLGDFDFFASGRTRGELPVDR